MFDGEPLVTDGVKKLLHELLIHFDIIYAANK